MPTHGKGLADEPSRAARADVTARLCVVTATDPVADVNESATFTIQPGGACPIGSLCNRAISIQNDD